MVDLTTMRTQASYQQPDNPSSLPLRLALPPLDALSQEAGARQAQDHLSIKNRIMHPATGFAKAAPTQQEQPPLLDPAVAHGRHTC